MRGQGIASLASMPEEHPPRGFARMHTRTHACTHTDDWVALLPELRAVNFDGHCVLSVVWVLKCELEELSCAQCGIQCVVGGDGLAQQVGDALRLGALPVGINDLQVP